MSESLPGSDEFTPLLDAACDGTLIESQIVELATVLDRDATARDVYLDHISLQTDIRVLARTKRLCNAGLAGVRATLPQTPSTTSTSPVPVFVSSSFHGATGYFSSGWPVAYLVATVVLGIGVLIGALVHVSAPAQMARPSSTLPYTIATRPLMVGAITGMVDCVLNRDECKMPNAELTTAIRHSTPLHLGDRLALKSGLLELTYDTGARVILQGPVTYEVESPAGGYLSIGKLTARLEKGSGAYANPKRQRGSGDEGNGNSPLSPLPSPLFSVRTPTAIVTDLGTEFGVEVNKKGDTTSHVFRGSVRVQRLSADGTATDEGQVLHKNQSARVAGDGASELTVTQPAKPSAFVREIPKQTIKTFDLVDVVAGGDGSSVRRNGGIDPLSGRAVSVRDTDAKSPRPGDGLYHRVTGSLFVDGVFVPNGGKGPVQVDSAGHTFDGFLETANTTWQYIWAGGSLKDEGISGVPTKLGDIDYASPDHGLIYFNGNSAITFDLEAIRKANPGYAPRQFLAAAANVGPEQRWHFADIIVLVDGRPCFQRWRIHGSSHVLSVHVPFGDKDRFLTLATTDGGDGIDNDWIIFGDPRLELVPCGTVDTSAVQRKSEKEVLP